MQHALAPDLPVGDHDGRIAQFHTFALGRGAGREENRDGIRCRLSPVHVTFSHGNNLSAGVQAVGQNHRHMLRSEHFVRVFHVCKHSADLAVFDEGQQLSVRDGGICHDGGQMIDRQDQKGCKRVHGSVGQHQHTVAVPESQLFLRDSEILNPALQHAEGNLPHLMIGHETADGDLICMVGKRGFEFV